MKNLEVAVFTETGSHIYTEITVSEDYTMNEVVNAIRDRGFVKFRLVDTMKSYAIVPLVLILESGAVPIHNKK